MLRVSCLLELSSSSHPTSFAVHEVRGLPRRDSGAQDTYVKVNTLNMYPVTAGCVN